MKMRKRILSLILSLAMAISLLPMTAFAEEADISNNVIETIEEVDDIINWENVIKDAGIEEAVSIEGISESDEPVGKSVEVTPDSKEINKGSLATYTKTDSLEEGEKYLIVASSSKSKKYYAFNTDAGKTEVTVEDDTVTVTDPSDIEWVATIAEGDAQKGGRFFLSNGEKYLYRSSSVSTQTPSAGNLPDTITKYYGWDYTGGALQQISSNSITFFLNYSDSKFTFTYDKEDVPTTISIYVKSEGSGEGGEEPVPPTPSGSSIFLAFTSDVHNSTSNFNNWISKTAKTIDTADIDYDFDNLGICGDLVSSSYNDAEVNAVTNVVKNSEDVVNDGFYVTGNHENSFNGGSFNFASHTAFTEPGKYFEGDNYYLYSMGARQWDEIYHPQNNSDSYNDMNKLETFLEEVDSNIPVFVLAHFPLHDFSGHSTSGGDGHGGTSGLHDGKRAYNSYQMIEIMSEYPNVFFLWGHNHSSSNKYYDKIYNNDSVYKLSTEDMGDVSDAEFTYAAAGCMKGQSGIKGYGLVAEIEGNDDGSTTVILNHYDQNGTAIGDEFETTFGQSGTTVIHTITATAGEHGNISPKGAVEVREGRTKTFTFEPDAGYLVDVVKVDGIEVAVSGDSYTFDNVSKDADIEVTFKKSDYLWDVTPSTDNPTETVSLEAGKQYKIKVTNGSSNSQRYSFKGTLNPSRIATLDPETSAEIAAGESVEFKITAGQINGNAVLTLSNGNDGQYERKATLNITVTGGTEPEPASGEVDITPTTGNPEVYATVVAGKTLAVNITNGTEYNNEWKFSVVSADEGIAKVLEPSTVAIGVAETETIEVEGVAKGTVDLTIKNNNDMEEYLRTAVIHLTVIASDAKIYTISFETNGGSTINAQSIVEGEKAKEPKAPIKNGVEFDGWFTDSGLTERFSFDTAVNSNLTLYAKWVKPTEKSYTVTWLGDNDTVLETDHDVKNGTTPAYDGPTPTKASTAQNTYKFTGWSPAISPVNEDIIYRAVFETIPRTYTIRWQYEDGTPLEIDVEAKYGDSPSYDGQTPIKAETELFTYTFSGWSPTVSAVTGDAIYTARFTESSKSYTVSWRNWNNDVILTQEVEAGTEPIYNGPIPTRAADTLYTYTFSGWTPELKVVTSDVIYKATYIHKSKGNSGSSSGGGSGGGGGSASGSGSASKKVTGGPGATPTYSPNWYTDAAGTWRIRNNAGAIVANAWLCDDVISANGLNVWYLLASDGSMIANGLVQDKTGNYYSLEMNHDGYYGMLRYKDGTYNCNGTSVYLKFSQNHDGTFGAIINPEGIEALKQIYGVTQYSIGNESCVYTSKY